jgi:sugar-specific transcriptional regulator TrmB
MNSKDVIRDNLKQLDLTNDEATIYIELFNRPNTHLQISRKTNINRAKVYRIVEQLEKRSLVLRRTDDKGTFLVANDPSALEIELIAHEEKLKQQRRILSKTIADLNTVSRDQQNSFVVRTFEGTEGFKRMQWHELKAEGEVLVLGNVTVEQLVGSRRWAERFRALSVANKHKTREIINIPYAKPDFTENEEFMELYQAHIIPKTALPASTPMVIYNDTVAVYQFDKEKRVGVEIVNAAYAQTMRHIFEHYWNLSTTEVNRDNSRDS